MRHCLLLVVLIVFALPVRADDNFSRVQSRIDQIGARIDLLFDQGLRGEQFEEDPDFEALSDELDRGDALPRYLEHLACHRVDASYALLRQWSARAERWVQRMQPEDELSEMAPFLRIAGVQSSLVLMQAAGTAQRCPESALQLLDLAQPARDGLYPGDPDLVAARFALARVGLHLYAQDGRARAHDMLAALQQLDSAASTALAPLGEETVDQIHTLMLDRETELQRVALATQSPLWRVEATASAKVREVGRMRCGFAMLGGLMEFLAFPALPHDVMLLAAQGQSQAAAAYALADLFEVPGQPRSRGDYEPADVVFANWGKEATQLALERAIDQIEFVQRGNEQVAILHLFGHAFLIESGEGGRTDGIRWYSKDEVLSRFRESSAYQALAGAAAK